MIKRTTPPLITRNLPINLRQNDIQLFEKALTYQAHAPHAYTFHNINILKDHIFHTAKFTFLHSFSHILPFSAFSQWKKLSWFLQPPKVIDRGIWITDEWSAAYFHWLTDALTRLTVVEEKTDVSPVLLPARYQQIPYIQASLQVLNIKAYYYNPRKRLLVKELIIPAHTAATGNYNETIIQRLQEKFITNNNSPATRKIYVSRQKANRRTITNETAVISVLQKYGYEIHCFEDYHFSDQIALMQQSKVLIGLHGAGLTNMLFMPAGAQILELRNAGDTHNNCFFSLASALRHRYYYLANTGDTADTFHVNITVDIDRLTDTLEQIN
ncbi:uncharacterized protein DUF563 [Chitinophaga dinghuensis]|uniref:Uncharacterized protein DUF563 n=1 Tax=Chitinophaga dinghuensis TaxID=1539050 RepID=A0A327W0V3_9BACT|nr:glycosyltransferase family 61 protein [Chitinophaga dinghuensis]RAJ81876.1 uncharacterized protein DUF563 [Chitinophaga dinghuensis]